MSKLDDLDELEVYGSEAQTGTTIASYTFEVFVFFLNIAKDFVVRVMKMGNIVPGAQIEPTSLLHSGLVC